jgi:DNA mismatch repair ATPase MutS
MSEEPYDKLSHLEGALRRVYQARRSLSHVDAGVIEPEEFEVLAGIVEDLENLEEMMESRASEQRVQRERRAVREERV